MRKLLVLMLLLTTFYCNAQITIFGIDITKNKYTGVKKHNCTPNPYFIFAEYSYQTIKFENYTAKTKTPQMKNPEKYMKELYTKLSKTLGKPFSILNINDSTTLSEQQIVWRFKYDSTYYLISLYKDTFGPFMIVQVSSSYEDMKSEIKWMESSLVGYWKENDLLIFTEYSIK